MFKKMFFIIGCLTLLIPFVLGAQVWEHEQRLTNEPSASYTGSNNAWGVAASGDTVHVVFYDYRDGDNEIFYKRSFNCGATWSPDTQLTSADRTSERPSVAVKGPNVHIVWLDNRDYNFDIYYKRSTSAGASWGPDTRLTTHDSISAYPSMAVQDTILHVVWFDDRDSSYEIYYKRSLNNGTTWGSDIRLTADDNDTSNFASVAAQGTNVHVVWFDTRDGNSEIYYKRSANNGTDWSVDTRLTTDNAVSQFPSIAAEGSSVHVVWQDNRDGNREIYYKRSLDGGTTWGQDVRLTNAAQESVYPSIAVRDSNVYIVWKDQRDGNEEIYYKCSTDNGTTWRSDTNLTSDAGSSKSSSIAADGPNVHVIWQDNRDGNPEIYYKLGGLMQPDNMVKNSYESTYTGDGVYNEDGSDQTSIQTVSAGDTAVYHIRIENDGGLVDTITVTGDTGADGWEVKYYDALTAGAEITSDITGAGWSTGELNPGEYMEIRVEVITDDSLPGDSTYDVLITSKSDRDTTKLDAVLTRTVIQSGFQPDNQIKNMEETTYIGDGVYNLDGTDQTKSQTAGAGDTVVYHIKIENDGNLPDTFILVGTAGNAGWTIRYFNTLTAGTEITSDITGSGWNSGELDPEDTTDIRVEVTSPSSATTGTSYDVLLTTTSASDNTRKDAVKATSTVGTSNVEEKIEPFINSLNVHPLSDVKITVSCTLAEMGTIELSVYDASGRLVKTLATGNENQGRHEYIWNGLDDSGKKVANGVYFIHLSAEKEVLKGRITIVK